MGRFFGPLTDRLKTNLPRKTSRNAIIAISRMRAKLVWGVSTNKDGSPARTLIKEIEEEYPETHCHEVADELKTMFKTGVDGILEDSFRQLRSTAGADLWDEELAKVKASMKICFKYSGEGFLFYIQKVLEFRKLKAE